MSGHNKWSSIKHKKGAADAKRGKIFSRLGKEVTLAARAGGGDPDLNPRLRSALSAAKKANMPNDNIDRAIKKGTGELNDGSVFEELAYEGYGPGGVAVIVNCLTDNRNRTASDVRSAFTRANGNLAGNGAVSWMFHRKARFVVEGEMADEEQLLELLLEGGADVEDISVEEDMAEIIGAPEAFNDILAVLEGAEIPVSESGLSQIPENSTEVDDVKVARQITAFIEKLEDLDDVQEVYSNLDMTAEVMEELDAE